MEKPAAPGPSTNGNSSSRELQCIGRLEIVRPKPVGFLCGSIPVPTDKSFHSVLIPSRQTVSAPRYRMLPAETDLNRLPVVPNFPDKALPIGALHSRENAELPWQDGTISSNLSRKCEALAVSGLAEFGDEIDVIAPADILKQIFKMPYSGTRLSIAVRRIGQTLVLNSGPDVEEGEKLVRRHNSKPKTADQSLFLNFAMHSVRVEACDCPPSHRSSSEKSKLNSSALPRGDAAQFVEHSNDVEHDEFNSCPDYSQVKQDDLYNTSKGHHPIKKASHAGEKSRCSVQDPEKHRRISNDGFLRILFWQFHNFRMLIGSDLLLFSNEKYLAVSLHLWDVTRQVTPLTWLEAWLDNVMANVPELAICYHQNGVVQGYELLKTDDIFLLKGVSDDGTPAFHPHVVQQNGLSVLRFLQENCNQDPGAYWLYKSAGEDAIQLFDLYVVPSNHSTKDCANTPKAPPLNHGTRGDSFFSLGTLLYRIAHRLSLSTGPINKAKCARFLRKCVEFLNDADHLVVHAYAHEQFARLLLNHEELKLNYGLPPAEYEDMVSPDCLDSFCCISESVCEDSLPVVGAKKIGEIENSLYNDQYLAKMNLEENTSIPRKLAASGNSKLENLGSSLSDSGSSEIFAVCKVPQTSVQVDECVTDPISSKLAAVHHVSQAIKSLRWMREMQSADAELLQRDGKASDGGAVNMSFSLCSCGDADCIEVCDIREWLRTSKIDRKLWKLILLLGESYLALAQAYKDNKQLHRALKVVELACSLYGSMPRYLEDASFISSIIEETDAGNETMVSFPINRKELECFPNGSRLAFDATSSSYNYWAKAWTLVGDVYVDFYIIKGKEANPHTRELRVYPEVIKEVQRLKKRLGQFGQNCSSCSLINCSCQSDRASSGNSASSSSGDKSSAVHSRKRGKRSLGKGLTDLVSGEPNDCEEFQNDKNGYESKGITHVLGDEISAHSPEAVSRSSVHGSLVLCQSETILNETPRTKNGGIFKYLGQDAVGGDPESSLSIGLSCYKEAKISLSRMSNVLAELQSVIKKVGWICNEMGRNRLEMKELTKAEELFGDAICAFREVGDHMNIILIFCNLGHGRRALAEEMVSKIESTRVCTILHNAYKQALQKAKQEYSEALKYYGAAKSEFSSISGEPGTAVNDLRIEVFTQLGNTYLRLGMLLAKEDITAKVYENDGLEIMSVSICGSDNQNKKRVRKREISANDAIREALCLYESLGEVRKQETAYAYFRLACHHRDCCLKFLNSGHEKGDLHAGEDKVLQRVKQYASLAERNWQKAIEFYGPKTYSSMHLSILMEKSALLSSLSTALHSSSMLESALSCLLEGRNAVESISHSVATTDSTQAKFWDQLQMLLKKMLASTISANKNKSSASVTRSSGYQPTLSRYGDVEKLRELYKMSLKSNDFTQLRLMYSLWIS